MALKAHWRPLSASDSSANDRRPIARSHRLGTSGTPQTRSSSCCRSCISLMIAKSGWRLGSKKLTSILLQVLFRPEAALKVVRQGLNAHRELNSQLRLVGIQTNVISSYNLNPYSEDAHSGKARIETGGATFL